MSSAISKPICGASSGGAIVSLAKAWICAAFVVPTARDRLGGRGEPEDREGAGAGRVVVGLLELRKAQLDEPGDLVVDPGLLFDQVHRKTRGLAKLGTRQWFPRRRLIGHPQGSEGTRVGGVALHPLQPALAEGFGRDRVDDRDRDGRPMKGR